MTNELTFQTRRDWSEARRTMGIGSSDAPVILGLSRYQSPYGLYCEKLGLGRKEDRERNEELLAWGNLLEEPIAQRYSMKTDRPVRNPRVPGVFFLERSVENPFMLASVDRYTFDPNRPEDGEGALEIKNAHLFMGEDWLELQEPPAEFQVQLQHQLAVTGKRWGSVACLIGGSKFVWKDVARDEEFIELLVAKEREFWERLTAREPPPIDGSEHTKSAIGVLHPKDNGSVIELEPEYLDLLLRREKLQAEGKTLKEQVDEIDNTLRARIGDATAGTLRDGSVVTWKWQSRNGYSVQPTEFRMLRVKLGKAAVA